MDKNIKSEIAIGIILIIAIIIGGFIWLGNRQQEQNQSIPTVITKTLVKNEPAKIISSFQSKKENGKMVLYKLYPDGTFEKSGLEVVYDWPSTYTVEVNIVISPDKTKAVYNKWNTDNLKMEIYVSDIDGKNIKKIAEQEVPEGSGELNQNSLIWTDDEHITYYETSANGEGKITPKIIDTYYKVDVVSGSKTVISK